MFYVDVPMTIADCWISYKALLDGIAEWGGKTSIAGINPEQPRTWIGHVSTLDEAMPGRWQRYVQDASIAANDQLTFRNHVILALAAEKARLLALANASVARISAQVQPASQPRQVTYSTTAMQQQQFAPVQQYNVPATQQASTMPASRVDELLNEARGYRRTSKWAQAKDVYSQVLAIQPGNPEAKEGLNVANQKASMKMLAIIMPIMCGGMIAFVVFFLWLGLNM
jgi:hypothetical protein